MFAANWAAQVVSNGGAAPSVSTQLAITKFQSGLVKSGLDAYMVAWNAFVPDNLIASITPQLQGPGSTPWTNHNFVSGDLTINGLLGDGATKYLDSGVQPQTPFSGLSNDGLTAYLSASGTGFLAGCDNGGAAQQIALTQGAFYSWTFAGGISAVNTGWTGYVSGNITGVSGASAIYKANSTTPHAALVTGTMGAGGVTSPPYKITVFCFNNNAGTSVFSNHRLSFFAITNGLLISQSSVFYDSIQTLRTAFGGGFV